MTDSVAYLLTSQETKQKFTKELNYHRHSELFPIVQMKQKKNKFELR